MSAKKSKKSAKKVQTLDPAAFSVGNHYGFNGFPNGDWQSATNPLLLPKVYQFRSLAEEAFHRFSRTELKSKSDLTRYLPGVHHEDFTNFYEVSRESTLAFSLGWFTEFGEIAKGNRDLVSEDPIWWAHAQAHALLCQELGVSERSTGSPFWRTRRWIQYFCDGDQPADAIDTANLETAEGFLRFATRSDWRAPKWLWAWTRKYYVRDSAPWKSLKTEAASMEQLGEQETEKLLTKITTHFWEHIDRRLSEHAARVSVGDAKTGISIPDASGLPVSADGANAAKENRPVTGKVGIATAVPSKTAPGAATAKRTAPGYSKRSEKTCLRLGVIFRAIDSGKTGLDYCKFLDTNGLTTPDFWRGDGCPESHSLAYQKPLRLGRKLQKLIRSEKSRNGRLYSKLRQEDPAELKRILDISRRPNP